MISFDVKALAKDLIMGRKEHNAAKEQLVIRMIEAAVDIVNQPKKQNEIMGPLHEIMESSYDLIGPSEIMLRYAEHIRKVAKRHGWDERLMVKLEWNKIGGGYHHGVVTMDLLETLKRYKPATPKLKREESLGEMVSDNPSLDSINEYFDAVSKRPKRRVPLLSDRLGIGVNDPQGRGFS